MRKSAIKNEEKLKKRDKCEGNIEAMLKEVKKTKNNSGTKKTFM